MPPLPATCSDVSTLFLVDDALADAAHPCHAWVDETHGRVARSSSASAVVWSLRTSAGTGLLVSATHTLGVGYFDPASGDVAEALVDPAEETGVPRIFLVEPDGTGVDADATPLFRLYNPAIPDDENTNGFQDILPVHDFYFGVVDDQKVASDLIVGTPDPLHAAPPAVYDPAGRTATAPTYTSADAGDLVLLVGFPAASPFAGRQSAGVGRVLSDAEAEAAIVDLAAVGDVEGDIAYRADVEMIIRGYASGGMSGGGVFDEGGRLVGVIVRASDPLGGMQYVRAVRMSYAVQELTNAFAALPAEEKAAVAPYVSPEVP